MTNKTEIDELWTAYTEAAKSSGMEGDLDIYNIEDMNDAAHALYTALATLLAERDAAVAEADRLRTNRDRFPELMAQVMAEKNLPLPDRIERLKDAIADLAPNIAKYQWVADEKPAFGERYIRHVAGDNGEGMGRQWLASCPPHIKGLAEYVAAANPDTVSMLLADIAAAVARAEKAEEEVAWQAEQRHGAFRRRYMNAPEDPHVEVLCERYGYGAVMDAASRLWARKDSIGAFYVGGCIGVRAALPADAGEGKPINWRDDPSAIVEDDEPQIGRDYA